MTTATVFFDTKTLLNFKPLDKIDWREILSVDAVVLQVVPIVIEQLHKVTMQDISLHLQNRARFTFSNLSEQLERGGYLSPGVALAMASESDLNFELEGLNRTSARDQIIASIISFQRDNPLEYVLLVSSDEQMISRAPVFGIDVITLPDVYRFPVSPARPSPHIEHISSTDAPGDVKHSETDEEFHSPNTVPRMDPSTLPSFKKTDDVDESKEESQEDILLPTEYSEQHLAADSNDVDVFNEETPLFTELSADELSSDLVDSSEDLSEKKDASFLEKDFGNERVSHSTSLTDEELPNPIEEDSWHNMPSSLEEDDPFLSSEPETLHSTDSGAKIYEELGSQTFPVDNQEDLDKTVSESPEVEHTSDTSEPPWLLSDEEDTAPPMAAGEAMPDWLQPDEEDTAPPMPAGEVKATKFKEDLKEEKNPLATEGSESQNGKEKPKKEDILDSPFLQSMDSKPRFKELNTQPAPLPSFEFLSGAAKEKEQANEETDEPTALPDWQPPHSIVPNPVVQPEAENQDSDEVELEKSDLLVQFSEGERRKNVLIRFPIKLSNGQVKKKIENLYNQYPKIPDIGPDANFRVGDGAFIERGDGDQKLLKERRLLRIKRYNASLDAFYAEHERYLHELSDHENQTKRSIQPAFRLVNNTEMTLRSIYVTLHFPSIIRVFSEDTVPAVPAGPSPPHIPDLDAPFDLIQLPSVPLPPELRQTDSLRLRHPNIPPNEIKWNNGWDAVYSIREIKPNNHALLNPLIVTFNSFESAKSLKIQYRIVAASISREE